MVIWNYCTTKAHNQCTQTFLFYCLFWSKLHFNNDNNGQVCLSSSCEFHFLWDFALSVIFTMKSIFLFLHRMNARPSPCSSRRSVQSITAGQTCPSLRQPTDKGLLLDPKLITNSLNAGRHHLKENYYSDVVRWHMVFLIISLLSFLVNLSYHQA